MELEKIKKPWYIPAFAWNTAVNYAANTLKEKLAPASVATFVAETEAKLLRKAVENKDTAAVEKVTSICKQATDHASQVMDVLKDSQITKEEEAVLEASIAGIVAAYVTAEEVNAKIDALAAKLKR